MSPETDAAPTDAIVTVRPATADDVPHLLRMVRDLATFEKSPESAVATEEAFLGVMFPQPPAQPTAWAHVAEVDGQVAAMAVWFLSFSTWTGKNGLYLEDLYVDPAHRGKGLASALIRALAAVAVERGYERFEWICLDWNTDALEIYRHLGAEPQPEWTIQRVSGNALKRLGGGTA